MFRNNTPANYLHARTVCLGDRASRAISACTECINHRATVISNRIGLRTRAASVDMFLNLRATFVWRPRRRQVSRCDALAIQHTTKFKRVAALRAVEVTRQDG